jgi:polynucleotide 5'-kinase involved in rRNA processing
MQLADDPEFRPFILGYLIQALDERYWPQLVEVALQHVEESRERQERAERRVEELSQERFG